MTHQLQCLVQPCAGNRCTWDLDRKMPAADTKMLLSFHMVANKLHQVSAHLRKALERHRLQRWVVDIRGQSDHVRQRSLADNFATVSCAGTVRFCSHWNAYFLILDQHFQMSWCAGGRCCQASTCQCWRGAQVCILGHVPHGAWLSGTSKQPHHQLLDARLSHHHVG